MLTITIPESEWFDEETYEFFYKEGATLLLEHSLISISKWESKWKKPFLHTEKMTGEEQIDYVKCMTLNSKIDPDVYNRLTLSNLKEINAYINDKKTATWFAEDNKSKRNKKIITSEIIYYWMISHNIPPEYQKWHLSRLLTLIRVCSEEEAPPKKMSRSEIFARNRKLNEARKKAHNSRG